MGGRYMSAGVSDAMARYYKLRLLCVDKCGMGGTADMDLKWRMQTWLGEDTFPMIVSFAGCTRVIYYEYLPILQMMSTFKSSLCDHSSSRYRTRDRS